MRNINELIGIIQGISFDKIINQKEVIRLQDWVDKSRNLVTESLEKNLISLVDKVLEDKIITHDEQESLLNECKNVQKHECDINNRIYELNGIISGIICDGEVNEEEIYSLKQWMDEYGDIIKHHRPSAKMFSLIESILEDEIITEDEQNELLEALTERVDRVHVDTKLDYLRKLVREKKNIGVEIIDILDNEDIIDEVHSMAEYQLKKALISYSGTEMNDPEIVFISLVLIGLMEYNDGNFYEYVRNTYIDLYKNCSKQAIENIIRYTLSRYQTESQKKSQSRKINVALNNAIVPRNYLPSFFEFIFDIYKINFCFTLSDNLYDDFKFVYEGLRYSLSDDDSINLTVTQKTYKLIKSTKELILDDKSLEAVIRLSIIVVRLIDKRVWNHELNIYNPYLKSGFEEWNCIYEATHTNESKNSTIRSRWEPKFLLSGETVAIIPPVHKVKGLYNYRNISITVSNGNTVIYHNNKPDIREIIGGYQVSVDRINISDPLGNITYKVTCGSEVIYDSRNKLHRSYIVFDNKGKEIHNNTDYEGTAFFCVKNAFPNLTVYCQKSEYLLAQKNVNLFETICIGTSIFNFASLLKPGIVGDKHEDCFLIDAIDNKKMCVYKSINYVVFEVDHDYSEIPRIEITLNNNVSDLSEYKFFVEERSGVTKYIVYLNINDPGIYSLSITSTVNGKRSNIGNFNFVLDRNLEYRSDKINDTIYQVEVITDLHSFAIMSDISVESFSEKTITLTIAGKEYYYVLPFNMRIFRVNDLCWQPSSSDMWIGDITQESVLDIYGHEADEIIVLSCTGKSLDTELQTKNMGVFRRIPIGFILSYKSLYDYIVIGIIHDGKLVNAIYCYNKCMLNKDNVEIEYSLEQDQLVVSAEYYGKGKVHFDISDEKGEIVYRSQSIRSKEKNYISNLCAGVKYTISFYEKAIGLSLGKTNLLASYPCSIFTYNELMDSELKISDIKIIKRNDEKLEKETVSLSYLFVKISDKKGKNGILTGEIYGKIGNGKFGNNAINPVDITFFNQIVQNKIEMYISKNDKPLLLDYKHLGSMDILHDKSVEEVTYWVKMDGENK
ncbi:MAG: hypothetical protein ACI4JM_10675 [Oscillospiraceae bacterium]